MATGIYLRISNCLYWFIYFEFALESELFSMSAKISDSFKLVIMNLALE